MSDGQDLNSKRTQLLGLWHEHGKTFNALVAAEQPATQILDRPLQDPDDKSKWNPQTIKHWRFFDLNKRLLIRRYGILAGPALTFDCQVPGCQVTLSQCRPKPREGLQHNGDPQQWYVAYPFLPLEVGFQ
jgi:hypothetical protein